LVQLIQCGSHQNQFKNNPKKFPIPLRLTTLDQTFDARIKTFLITRYRTSFLFYSKEIANYDAVTATLFLSKFFGKDRNIVNALWLGNDGKSFFAKIFSSQQNNLNDIMEYVATVEGIYGLQWPELTKFIKKRGRKFFLVDRQVSMCGDEVIMRLFRLLELVQRRLSSSRCKEFFGKFFFDMIESLSVNFEAITEVMERTRKVVGGRKKKIALMRGFVKKSNEQSCIFDENFVAFFWKSFLTFAKNDGEIIKSVLDFNYVPTSQLLVNAFASNNANVANFYKQLFKRHLTDEEILKTFVIPKDFYVTNLFWRVSHMEPASCQRMVDFIVEIKGENDEMVKKILAQRNDEAFSVFGCLKLQEESSVSDEVRQSFGEKFEIFKRCAGCVFSDEEIDALCESPKVEFTWKNYVVTNVINRKPREKVEKNEIIL
jgi:hypothetical protein